MEKEKREKREREKEREREREPSAIDIASERGARAAFPNFFEFGHHLLFILNTTK